MRKALTRTGLVFAAVCFAASAAIAQSDATRYSLECRDNRSFNDGTRARHCEVKEITLAATAGALDVDGMRNGGISVKGWDRGEVLVRYQIQTQAYEQAEADALAARIRVNAVGGQIRAEGPEAADGSNWAVSYEIFVPHRTDLSLRTHNGGISVADVSGRINFEAKNGGVSLKRLGGDVRGETRNGGLSVELAGNNWEGEGLNVKTTNGGLSIVVPDNYSASLEMGTVNGALSVSPSIARVTRETKRLSLNLGSGGQNLRMYTTNGGISVKRRESM